MKHHNTFLPTSFSTPSLLALIFSLGFGGVGLLSLSGCRNSEKEKKPVVEKAGSRTPHGQHHGHRHAHKSMARSTGDEAKAPVSFDKPAPVGTKARCPVMGNEFSISEKSEHSVYKGRHYYFCCGGCKPKFDENPQKYL